MFIVSFWLDLVPCHGERSAESVVIDLRFQCLPTRYIPFY